MTQVILLEICARQISITCSVIAGWQKNSASTP